MAFIFGFCCLVFFTTSSPAQTTDSRPGIALVKPQAWSKPAEATVSEFIGYIDRTPEGATGAGYYELKTKLGDKRQVPASRIVKIIVYPDVSVYTRITSPSERDALAAVATDLKTAISDYPSTRSYLDPSLKALNKELAQYDAGNVKIDGAWVSRETYVAGQVRVLGGQLRSDIVRANPTSSFDLHTDPRFVGLQDMAATSASAKALVKELSETYDKLLRVESRQALLASFDSNALAYSEAQGAVERLKTLKPEEDPRSLAFIKKWDASIEMAKQLRTRAEPLAREFDDQMKNVTDVAIPPLASPELLPKINALDGDVKVFLATKPAPVLVNESDLAISLTSISAAFNKLQTLFPAREFLQAKELLDPLVARSSVVGPETKRVAGLLQTYVSERIRDFSRQREEAKIFFDSGKHKEALEKFEAAYAVIPDPTVGEQISQLKEALGLAAEKK
ncbi:hypothetical protein DB345_01135 [Spartobacteria bacterium LR76]|nr:hypothetical protein DB345_01135 [Spartobacteria bacterium LR76]